METSDRLANEDLDFILAVQLSVAWAGEKGGDPPRIGWWDTDLVDEAAGGDLYGRLLPRTAAWAGLEAVRLAAIRADKKRREQLADADHAITLFHFGFHVDEQLRDRLRDHKRRGASPAEVLGKAYAVAERFDRSHFEAYLSKFPQPKTQVIPGARQIGSRAQTATDRASLLAAALLPIAGTYPLPFFAASP